LVTASDEVVVTTDNRNNQDRWPGNCKRALPFKVFFLARAILLVFDGIFEFVANITVRVGFASLVPLLMADEYPNRVLVAFQ
jgi:hypothetical protein